jgi:dihydropteroate synthase
MTAYEIKFRDARELAEALKALGQTMRSLPFFDNRREIKSVYITNVDVRAANVIKQEMLSRGGDAAVHAHAVDCGVTESDVILFGTVKQISFLADKLETMPWWGFPDTVKNAAGSACLFFKKISDGRSSFRRFSDLGDRTLLMSIINLSDDLFTAKAGPTKCRRRRCACSRACRGRSRYP